MKSVNPKLLAWLSLVALTFVSVQAAHQAHGGASRMAMSFAIAAIAWSKGLILIRHYLESRRAGPVFHRIMLLFAAVAPLALMVSGWREL